MSNTKIMQWKLLVFCLVLLVIFLVRGVFNSHDEQTLKEMRIIMGTMVTITAHHHDAGVLSNAIDAAFKRINQIDALMSTYKEESELSLLNKAKKPGRYPVSNDLWNVLELAGRMYQQTDGVFDVTVKPLWDVWQLAADTNKMPLKSEIEKILDGIGWRHIKLHSDSKEIEFVSESCMIVLGGIAKGYAVDVAIEALRDNGVQNCLVDAGGDIFCSGVAPDGKPWKIGVRNPFRTDSLSDTVRLKDMAVVTSGNYERMFEVENQKFSQIIDPRTGYPTIDIASVTIIAPNTAVADALATALMVMDTHSGIALINRMSDTEALIISTVNGEKKVISSDGFSTYESK